MAEKAKVFVLWVLLSKQLKESLRFEGWVQHYTRGVALGDPTVQTYDVLAGWVRKLKGIPTVQQRAEAAIHRQEVVMWEGETLQELIQRIWKVGRDAWGDERGWDHNKRRLVAKCFENATKHHRARPHMQLHQLRIKSQQWIAQHLKSLDD